MLKDASGNDVYVNPKIVISFPSGTDETDVESFMDGIEGLTSYSLISSPNQNLPKSAPGATTASISYDGFDMYLVSINTADGYSILDTIESLISNPGEACTIMPDTTVTAKTSAYNDPYYSSEWYVNSTAGVNAVTAWNTTTGYSSIKIAVLDTGIANDHPDLTVSDGLNCKPTGGEDEWYPTETYANHGTTVAGVICATGNNSIGIVGVAPNVTVLSINIAYDNTSLGGFKMDPVLVAEGIEWAAAQNCRITNSSWASNSESFLEPVLEAFANTRISNQMVHFAASGNAGTSSISTPSSADGVISVGATTSSKIKASYSQYGTGLDLVAPGSSIITTDRVGSLGYSTTDYTTNNGTSYASPIAAACAALVLSKNPALTAAAVENVLKTTATDLGTSGYDTSYGYGLVKVSAALAAVDPYVFFGATNSTGG